MALNLILGIDAGLNDVKVVGGRGELKFPSSVEICPQNFKDFSNMISLDERFEIEWDEERYFLGKHAEFLNTYRTKRSGNRDGSKNDEEAFLKAVGGVCKYIDTYEDFEEEEINAYVFYGSPINNTQKKSEVDEIVNRFKNNDIAHEVIFNDIPLKITFKGITVMPEGIAAFFSQAWQQTEVFIVDAGSQTINLTALLKGVPVPSATKNTDEGVEHYKEWHGARAAKRLAKDILKEINSLKWGREESGKYTIYVCGGYAVELATAFNDLNNPRFTMEIMKPELAMSRKSKPLEPIYANAAGMYFFAKNAYTSQAKG